MQKLTNLYNSFFDFDIKSEGVILFNNLNKVLIIVAATIMLNVSIILIFFKQLNSVSASVYAWKMDIIIAHSIILSVMLPLLIIILLTRRKNNFKINRVISEFVFVFILLAATGIACFDQAVTPSITPLNVILLIAFAVKISPSRSLLYIVISFIYFYFGITYFSTDPQIILSNRVNAITIYLAGFLLSTTIWRSSLIEYKQNELIELQKKQLEERLEIIEQKSVELTKLNKDKDTFFAVIAHDLRNPIANILSLLNLIGFTEKEEKQSRTDKIYRLLEQLGRTTRNTQKLLDNLLQWAQSQRSEFKLCPTKFKFEDLIHNVSNELIDSIKDKGLEIVISENSKYTFIEADTQMLQTIVRNIVSNAIKFSYSGGLITINIEEKENDYYISIADSGVGMDAETAKNLFDLSKKNSTPGTMGELGTGLGLILCKEYIVKHKGAIWAESTEGKGSTIFFTLPKNYVPEKVS